MDFFLEMILMVILVFFLFVLIFRLRRIHKENMELYNQMRQRSEEIAQKSIVNQGEIIVLLREIRDLLKK